MSKPPDLRQVKDHRSAVKFATSHGWTISHGGSHDIVKSDTGLCALPRHKGDYCKGTAHSIQKTFALMLAVLVCAIVFVTVI